MTLLQMASAAAPPEMWEVTKGVMMFVITGLLTMVAKRADALVKQLADQAKRQVNLEHIVVGVDGANGLRSRVSQLEETVEDIHTRNERIDAVAEYERQQYQGEDRRAGPRRIRDVVHEVEDLAHRKAQ